MALVLSLVGLGQAKAYRTTADLPGFEGSERVVWSTGDIRLQLGAPPEGITEDDWLQAARGAADAWNAVTCSSARIVVNRADAEAVGGDGLSHVSVIREGWAAMGLQEDAAGTTDLGYVRMGDGRMGDDEWQITETDVLLNGGMEFAIDPPMLGSARDLRTVLTHEFGHVLGLAHNCEPDGSEGAPTCDASHEAVTLFPLYRGPEMRMLSDDDVAGACFLYPETEPECSLDADCSVGRCSDSRCVGAGAVGDHCALDAECADGVCSGEGYCTRRCGSCPVGWRCESICRPEGGVFGDACGHGNDCASGLCLERASTGTCTRACGAGCPAGARCSRVDGQEVCVVPRAGCSALAGTQGAVWMLALVIWRRSRRKR